MNILKVLGHIPGCNKDTKLMQPGHQSFGVHVASIPRNCHANTNCKVSHHDQGWHFAFLVFFVSATLPHILKQLHNMFFYILTIILGCNKQNVSYLPLPSLQSMPDAIFPQNKLPQIGSTYKCCKICHMALLQNIFYLG